LPEAGSKFSLQQTWNNEQLGEGVLPGHVPALNQHQWQVYRNATGKTRALVVHRLPKFDRQSSSLTSCIKLAP